MFSNIKLVSLALLALFLNAHVTATPLNVARQTASTRVGTSRPSFSVSSTLRPSSQSSINHGPRPSASPSNGSSASFPSSLVVSSRGPRPSAFPSSVSSAFPSNDTSAFPTSPLSSSGGPRPSAFPSNGPSVFPSNNPSAFPSFPVSSSGGPRPTMDPVPSPASPASQFQAAVALGLAHSLATGPALSPASRFRAAVDLDLAHSPASQFQAAVDLDLAHSPASQFQAAVDLDPVHSPAMVPAVSPASRFRVAVALASRPALVAVDPDLAPSLATASTASRFQAVVLLAPHRAPQLRAAVDHPFLSVAVAQASPPARVAVINPASQASLHWLLGLKLYWPSRFCRLNHFPSFSITLFTLSKHRRGQLSYLHS
ncbi:hypothetical protein FA15DRAFT_754482 [Coprinopsis marcescibilis]|uniref:Uncharacterized protein n=1 Tax=Coprinopsis marcescibilis TaxID=230819 RepID=A0A5C3L3Q2_COPMA|nr:hypothetical protein FA15DRAFT_754482 [Coprinopsis marcescibilis]